MCKLLAVAARDVVDRRYRTGCDDQLSDVTAVDRCPAGPEARATATRRDAATHASSRFTDSDVDGSSRRIDNRSPSIPCRCAALDRPENDHIRRR